MLLSFWPTTNFTQSYRGLCKGMRSKICSLICTRRVHEAHTEKKMTEAVTPVKEKSFCQGWPGTGLDKPRGKSKTSTNLSSLLIQQSCMATTSRLKPWLCSSPGTKTYGIGSHIGLRWEDPDASKIPRPFSETHIPGLLPMKGYVQTTITTTSTTTISGSNRSSILRLTPVLGFSCQHPLLHLIPASRLKSNVLPKTLGGKTDPRLYRQHQVWKLISWTPQLKQSYLLLQFFPDIPVSTTQESAGNDREKVW